VRIEYVQPAAGDAAIRIYNIAGSLVRSLHASVVNPGNQVFLWDGCDEEGRVLPSGVYLTQITAGRIELSGKAVLGR
jgi:flagellar hook assembly protein FlgD